MVARLHWHASTGAALQGARIRPWGVRLSRMTIRTTARTSSNASCRDNPALPATGLRPWGISASDLAALLYAPALAVEAGASRPVYRCDDARLVHRLLRADRLRWHRRGARPLGHRRPHAWPSGASSQMSMVSTRPSLDAGAFGDRSSGRVSNGNSRTTALSRDHAAFAASFAGLSCAPANGALFAAYQRQGRWSDADPFELERGCSCITPNAEQPANAYMPWPHHDRRDWAEVSLARKPPISRIFRTNARTCTDGSLSAWLLVVPCRFPRVSSFPVSG